MSATVPALCTGDELMMAVSLPSMLHAATALSMVFSNSMVEVGWRTVMLPRTAMGERYPAGFPPARSSSWLSYRRSTIQNESSEKGC